MSTSHDFDFLMGAWKVRHRRLKERLLGCQDWERFDGETRVWPLLDGRGNVDDNLLHLPSGPYRAVSLRAFDEAAQQWSIWWLDGRQPHQLDPPVVGGFADGVGEFQCDDELRGQPIRVRFRWTGTSGLSPRWEQAFSADGGRSWEINWEMDFERLPEAGSGG